MERSLSTFVSVDLNSLHLQPLCAMLEELHPSKQCKILIIIDLMREYLRFETHFKIIVLYLYMLYSVLECVLNNMPYVSLVSFIYIEGFILS